MTVGRRLSSQKPGGTAFQLSPPIARPMNWTYNVRYAFSATNGDGDEAYSRGGLMMDGQGTLYGPSYGGGDEGTSEGNFGHAFSWTKNARYEVWEFYPATVTRRGD
jgi:hypothetical protein